MGHRRRGRHRAPRKSMSKLVLPTLLVTLLPISTVLGYVNLTTDTATQINSVDPYAGTITIAATPLGRPTTTPDLQANQAPPAEIPGTNHTTPPTTGPQKRSESDVGSTESTQDPLPTTEAPPSKTISPTTATEPPPTNQKIKSSSKCANLESKENVVTACNAILSAFPQVTTVGGLGDRPKNPHSCHPLGLGLDVMVDTNELGDEIVKWISSRKKELQIAYVGWEVPDHFDHVHLSFDPCKG